MAGDISGFENQVRQILIVISALLHTILCV